MPMRRQTTLVMKTVIQKGDCCQNFAVELALGVGWGSAYAGATQQKFQRLKPPALQVIRQKIPVDARDTELRLL